MRAEETAPEEDMFGEVAGAARALAGCVVLRSYPETVRIVCREVVPGGCLDGGRVVVTGLGLQDSLDEWGGVSCLLGG